MTNQFWDQQEMDALFTVAEDIYRFDPWESRIAPLCYKIPMPLSQPCLWFLGRTIPVCVTSA